MQSPRPDGSAASANDLRKLYVEITTDCDLDCGMCVRRLWRGPGQAMTALTFAALVEQLRSMPSVSTVSFGGFGEPTLHPLLFDFLREVKQAGRRAELVTNGVSLRGQLAQRLVDLGLDRLIVSLDGVASREHPVLHADSRLVRGNLEALEAMRASRRAELPEVWVQFVATRRNIDQLPALRSLAPMLGCSGILVTHLVPYSRELAELALYRWSPARRNGPPSPWNPIVSLPRFDAKSPLSAVAARLHARGSRLQVCGADVAGAGMRCRFVAEGCAAITPEGNVSPCLPLMHAHQYWFQGDRRDIRPYHVGNVNERTLEAIWQGDEYRGFRQRVRDFPFSPCIDCNGCELRRSNLADCTGEEFPRCGACLWAAGLVQCP